MRCLERLGRSWNQRWTEYFTLPLKMYFFNKKFFETSMTKYQQLSILGCGNRVSVRVLSFLLFNFQGKKMCSITWAQSLTLLNLLLNVLRTITNPNSKFALETQNGGRTGLFGLDPDHIDSISSVPKATGLPSSRIHEE